MDYKITYTDILGMPFEIKTTYYTKCHQCGFESKGTDAIKESIDHTKHHGHTQGSVSMVQHRVYVEQ